MVPNIPTDIFYANAFYARQADFISYEDLKKYKTILSRKLYDKYRYFSFSDPQGFWPYPIRVEEHFYEINEITFIKEIEGVLLASNGELNRQWIEKVNYYYPDDVKEILRDSWSKFANKNQKIKKKSR